MLKPEKFVPTFLYISPGPHDGPPVNGVSSTYGTSPPVTSAAELEDALELGFHLTLAQAVGLAPAPPKPSEAKAAAEAEAAAKQKAFDDAVEAKVAEEIAKRTAPVVLSVDPVGAAPVVADREALEAEAKSLGIPYAGNMSDKKLADAIAAKKKA